MLKIVKYEENLHYPIFETWWEQWGLSVIPPEMLPPTGFLVFEENKYLTGCFIYFSGNISVIEWFTINPFEKNKPLRNKAFDFLVESVLQYCRDKGSKTTLCSTNNRFLIKRLAKHSKAIERNVCNLIF